MSADLLAPHNRPSSPSASAGLVLPNESTLGQSMNGTHIAENLTVPCLGAWRVIGKVSTGVSAV